MKAQQSFETSGSIGLTTARYIPEAQASAKPLGEPQIRWKEGWLQDLHRQEYGQGNDPRQAESDTLTIKNMCTSLVTCASYFGCSHKDEANVIFKESTVR